MSNTRTDFNFQRDSLIGESLHRSKRYEGPCEQATRAYFQDHYHKEYGATEGKYYIDWEGKWLSAGNIMEKTKDLIDSAAEQLKESRHVLQELSNDIKALSDVIQPALVEHIGQIRTSRMTAVNEIRATLADLREIRKFFLESDYQAEMDRLERFVALCKELKRLKEDGVLDVICDSAIRLAVKEEAK